MTTLTYFEPLLDGHCTFWAQMVLRAAAQDSRISRIIFVASAELVGRLEGVLAEGGIETVVLGSEELGAMREGRLLSRGWAQWRCARALANENGGVVFLPFFDHAVVAAALDRGRSLGCGRISGIIFRPPNRFGLNWSVAIIVDSIRRWISYMLARGPAGGKLFTLDEVAPHSLAGHLTRSLDFLPDPMPEPLLFSALERRPRNDGRRVALLFGALTERKGIYQILRAWQMQNDAFHECTALRLVGRLGDSERVPFRAELQALHAAMPQAVIELEDRFVSEAELAQEVADADLILAPYQNHVGSSGVLGWAGAAGKPLLTQNTGLLGFQAARYGFGVTLDCSDTKSLARAIGDPWPQQGTAVASFLTQHTPLKFTSTLLDGCIEGPGQ